VKVLLLSATAILATASLLSAQLPIVHQAMADPAPAVQAPDTSGNVHAAILEPTELEKTQLENIQLKFSILHQQQIELQSQYSSLIQKIVSEHPGYFWDPATSSLKPVHQPTKAPTAPSAPAPAKK
jgi:hypothetical protein